VITLNRKTEVQALINRLNEALVKFESCPDRQRAWELNLANAVVFAIEDLEKLMEGL